MREDTDQIIAKSPRQTSVSTLGPMLPVLVEALEAFDDAYTASQAYTRALHDWHRNRQENSKRAALREIKADTTEIKGGVDELLLRMAKLEAEMAAVKRAIQEKYETAVADGCDAVQD